MKENPVQLLSEEFFKRNKFSILQTNPSFNSPRYETQINERDYLYLRPSFLGGYYWGLSKLKLGETVEYEIYDCPPISTVDQFKSLHITLTGKVFQEQI